MALYFHTPGVGYFNQSTYTKTGKNAFYNLRRNYYQEEFKKVLAAPKLGGMPAHHVIPLEFSRGTNQVGEARAVKQMMDALQINGLFSFIDGNLNAMWLPSAPKGAYASGLAIHATFDFHKTYSAAVGSALVAIKDIYFGIKNSAGVTTGFDYSDPVKLMDGAAAVAGLQYFLATNLGSSAFVPAASAVTSLIKHPLVAAIVETATKYAIKNNALKFTNIKLPDKTVDKRDFTPFFGDALKRITSIEDVNKLADTNPVFIAGSEAFKLAASGETAAFTAVKRAALHLANDKILDFGARVIAQTYAAAPKKLPGKKKAALDIIEETLVKKVSLNNLVDTGKLMTNIVISKYDFEKIAALFPTDDTYGNVNIGDLIKKQYYGFSFRYKNPGGDKIEYKNIFGVYGAAINTYERIKEVDDIKSDPTNFSNPYLDEGVDPEAGEDPGPDNSVFGVPTETAANGGFIDDTGVMKVSGELIYSVAEDLVEGTDGGDVIVAYRTVEVKGGKGNDWIIGFDTASLNGGEGDDVIMAFGKQNTISLEIANIETLIVEGGTGRDFIFVTVPGAEVYGDTKNKYYEKPVLTASGIQELDANGKPRTILTKVEDVRANADHFWYWPGVTIMDPQHHDILSFFGLPLTGGNIAAGGALAEVNTSFGGYSGGGLALAGLQTTSAAGQGSFGGLFWDNLVPFITYVYNAKTNTLYVINYNDALSSLIIGHKSGLFNGTGLVDDPSTIEDETTNLQEFMTIKNFEFWGSYRGDVQGSISGLNGQEPVGSLNMVFKQINPVAAVLDLLPPTAIGAGIQNAFGGGSPLIDATFTLLAAAARQAKALLWADDADPLVLDLNGNGIEFASLGTSNVYFDLDGDKFRERTAWLGGSDGFLAVDANHNGRIDDISELFGGVGVSGLGELAGYDSNHDGVVDARDAKWAELRVWRDLNQNGVTDAGELKTLAETGIVSLTVTPIALNATTPQGVYLSDRATFTRTDGSTGRTFDAILPMDNVDTKYAGESGRAAWQQPLSVGGALLDAKGFGTVTNLAVAAANDIALGELATQTAATMTVPKLKTLVAQAGAVLGAWGAAMPLTQELVAVRLGLDANGNTVLLDRAEYVEDATGGFWTLHSNTAVLDAQGNVIARATLEDIIAQGADWQLEQAWSPSTRGTAVQHRDPAPYLVQIVAGRAVVLDHGVEQADGSWRLASGAPVLDASGNVIAAATRDDILHQAHAAGLEWRVEQIGFNPNANLPVAAIGVRFTDGHVVDYTVLLTDRDGAFYVWARNLDRALELEAKTGDSREFNLRNYEVDFAHLDEVGSTDDL